MRSKIHRGKKSLDKRTGITQHMFTEIIKWLACMHTIEIGMKEIMSVDGEVKSEDEWFGGGAAGTQMTVEGEESSGAWW